MRKRILGIALLGFAASIPLAALVPMVRRRTPTPTSFATRYVRL